MLRRRRPRPDPGEPADGEKKDGEDPQHDKTLLRRGFIDKPGPRHAYSRKGNTQNTDALADRQGRPSGNPVAAGAAAGRDGRKRLSS